MVSHNDNGEVITMLEDVVDSIVNKVIEGKCTAALSEEILSEAVKSARRRGYLSLKSYDHLYKRADSWGKHEGRTLTQFFSHIKKNCKGENKLCDEFISLLRKRGETASYKSYGNKDEGRVRITNYDNEPDIILTRNGEDQIMDVKSLRDQEFKIGDLSIYSGKGAGMIVKSHNSFWVYKPEIVQKLLEWGKKDRYKHRHSGYNKLIVRVGKSGDPSIIDLKQMVDNCHIEQIPCGEKNDK